MRARHVLLTLALLWLTMVNAHARGVKTVYLGDNDIAQIPVSSRGTVLSFPAKPSKVILGNTGAFGIEYVEQDLAISPLKTGAKSNLFVYLLGRRFAFDLRTAMEGGESIIIVRDAVESKSKGGRHGRR